MSSARAPAAGNNSESSASSSSSWFSKAFSRVFGSCVNSGGARGGSGENDGSPPELGRSQATPHRSHPHPAHRLSAEEYDPELGTYVHPWFRNLLQRTSNTDANTNTNTQHNTQQQPRTYTFRTTFPPSAASAASTHSYTGRRAGAPSPKDEKKEAIRRGVWALPIEEYIPPSALNDLSTAELVHLLREAAKCRRTELDPKQTPLERDELVKLVAELRGGDGGSSCALCLEDFSLKESVRVLRCGHRFHIECVDRWLLPNTDPTCPLCKASIL